MRDLSGTQSFPAPPTDDEDPAARLARLWQEGQRPDVREFLARTMETNPLRIAEVLRVDQRERWRLGNQIPAEAYLRDFPAVAADPEAALDLAYQEFVLREALGEAPDPQEYVRRFPDLAERFGVQIEFHRAIGPDRPAPTADIASTTSTSRTSRPAEPGFTLGPYDLLEVIGEGGMGRVYRARHRILKRVDAVKSIHPERARDPRLVARFLQEAEAVARLRHPNVVTVHAADQAGDLYYLAMEFVPGPDLRKVLRNGPLDVAAACGYVRQAALGLQHAHERGLVHRDVKPGNLLLAPDGTVKVTDFGLARLLPLGLPADTTATSAGAILGTVDYMAPEQADDPRRADIRSDLYSLGCTLFELLSGRVPFPADTPMARLRQHATDPPPPLEQLRPDVPTSVCAVVEKLLAKRPVDRFQTPAELVAALDRAGADRMTESVVLPAQPPIRRRKWWPWMAGAAVVAVGVVVAVLAATGDRTDPNPDADPNTNPHTPPHKTADNAGEPAGTGKPVVPQVSVPKGPFTIGTRFRSVPETPGDRISIGTTPEGDVLCARANGVVEVWSGSPDRPTRRVTLKRENPEWSGFAFSPDGRWVVGGNFGLWRLPATGDTAEPVTLASTDSRVLRKGEIGHTQYLAFYPDTRTVLAGVGLSRLPDGQAGKANYLVSWDRDTGQLRQAAELPPVPGGVNGLAVSADARRFIGRMEDGQVFGGDTADLKPRPMVPVEAVRGKAIAHAIDPTGTLAFTAHAASDSGPYWVIGWDVAAGREVYRFDQGAHTRAMAISPDGKMLAVGGYSFKLWRIEPTGATPATTHIDNDERVVFDLRFWGPDAVLAGMEGSDETAQIWPAK